jgi:hypothetical protein
VRVSNTPPIVLVTVAASPRLSFCFYQHPC